MGIFISINPPLILRSTSEASPSHVHRFSIVTPSKRWTMYGVSMEYVWSILGGIADFGQQKKSVCSHESLSSTLLYNASKLSCVRTHHLTQINYIEKNKQIPQNCLRTQKNSSTFASEIRDDYSSKGKMDSRILVHFLRRCLNIDCLG